MNVTLFGDASYFIKEAYDQWKSEESYSQRIYCMNGKYDYPVQITLTGRGHSYGFNNSSKIRLSIVIPQKEVAYILNTPINVIHTEKRFIVADVKDFLSIEKTEIHIENTLSEIEIKSISEATFLIRTLEKDKEPKRGSDK